jgi:hypothetical protein
MFLTRLFSIANARTKDFSLGVKSSTTSPPKSGS